MSFILLWILSTILAFLLTTRWFYMTDVVKIAVELRREKNKQHAKYIAKMPNCNYCGAKLRPVNFYPH